MGRPKSYIIDSDAILRRIHELTIGLRAELQAEIDALPPGADSFHHRQQLHRESTAAEWADYPAAVVDPGASDGLRRATLRAVLDLEKAGLVRGCGDRLYAIQLTDKGVQYLQEQEGGSTDASDT